MTKIYSNDYLNIVEEKGNIFKINFEYQNSLLINSLLKTRIIQGGSASNNFQMLKFKANSVKTFREFQNEDRKNNGSPKISVNNIALLLSNLSCQLNYLINVGSQIFIGYNLNDLIVINNNRFIFLGCEYLSEIYDNNMTLISYPFSQNDFFASPELLKITEIPSYIHYKTCYFSLGLFLLHLITNNDEIYGEYLRSNSEEERYKKIEEWLNRIPIKNTKIYFVLSRCLNKIPTNRSIIFV
jgi:hypothetical protein